jgi:hypothetical protein
MSDNIDHDVNSKIAKWLGKDVVYDPSTRTWFERTPVYDRGMYGENVVWIGFALKNYVNDGTLFFDLINELKKRGWGLHSLSSCSPTNNNANVILCSDFDYAHGNGTTILRALCDAILDSARVDEINTIR